MDTQARMAIYSFLSYANCWKPRVDRVEAGVVKALGETRGELGFEGIAWGPVAYRKRGFVLTDSLMFAVKDASPEGTAAYTLVIRGTNPGSITSWIFQDLAVSGLVPWTRQSPRSEFRDAWVSIATDNALEIHEGLESGGKTVLAWLGGLLRADPALTLNLAITGHSLGGLMSTVFALYLHDELSFEKLIDRVKISVHAFAGPTAGNEEFSSALESTFGDRLFLYDNPLDLAPLAWEERNVSNVMKGLYLPKIKPNRIEANAIAAFAETVRGLGFAKPARKVEVHSTLVDVPLNDYLLEAVVQHVAPYAEGALLEAPRSVDQTVREIVKQLLGVAQFAKLGRLRALLTRLRRRRLRKIGAIKGYR